MGKITTATVAAKEATAANHETENVSVTNSGDAPASQPATSDGTDETSNAAPVSNHETETTTSTNSGDPVGADAPVRDAPADITTAPMPTPGDEPANIPPATEIDTSGAPQQLSPGVDLTNPAVDADPRRGTSVNQNRIDFNDPTISGREAVERALGMTSSKGE